RIGGVRVLEGAAHGAGGLVLEVGGELGGDPGEASAAQRGLGLGVLAGGAQRGLGGGAGRLDGLLLGGGRGPRPLDLLGGAVRGPGVAETGGGGAGAVPLLDERGALRGPLAELRGRGFEALLLRGEGVAARGERRLPLGQAGLEIDQLAERAGPTGRLLRGDGQRLLGGILLEQVHELGVFGPAGGGEGGERLDRLGGGRCGAVAAAQQLDDGPRGLVLLQRGTGPLDGGPLPLEPGGEGVELAAPVDAGAGAGRGVGGGAGLLLGRPCRGGGGAGVVGAGGDGGEVFSGQGGQGVQAQGGGVL